MKSVEQILHDCYVNGVRIDPEPYHQYLESGSTEPKTLRQMESLISYAAGTGRVHPSFGRHHQNGRITYRNPNLVALGWKAKALILPDEGHVMMQAYFRHAELRAAAVLSGDLDFLALLAQPDVHQYMADKMGIGRTSAKQAIFNGLYRLEFPHAWEYLSHFPKLFDWVSPSDPDGDWVYSRPPNRAHDLQRFCAEATDLELFTVQNILTDTGARVLCPMPDGIYLSCPMKEQEQVKALVLKAMEQNLLDASVEVSIGANMAAL